MKVHFICQEAWTQPGEYERWARRNGCEITMTRCWQNEKVPEQAQADLLIVLGGWMNPDTTLLECPTFDTKAQQALILEYVRLGRAVIGVCLGAQLIGQALGARFEISPEREVGAVKTALTKAGREDPLLADFPGELESAQWHRDMMGLTKEAAVLAESPGCPRQIVRYAPLVYGFQAHMEFTKEILEAGIKMAGGEIPWEGPFVQKASTLLSFDCREMNRLLSCFLDRLKEKLEGRDRRLIAEITRRMILFSKGNRHDIRHFLQVHAYAETIGTLEGLSRERQFILEAASLVHDAACPLCREKYGNTDGAHQEAEGPAIARALLSDLDLPGESLGRIVYLVGHHHTYSGVDGLDWQILLEADFIANADENGYDREKIRLFAGRTAKTKAGRALIESVFGL